MKEMMLPWRHLPWRSGPVSIQRKGQNGETFCAGEFFVMRGYLSHHRMFSSIPDNYSLHTSSIFAYLTIKNVCTLDNQKLPSVLWEVKVHPLRTTAVKKMNLLLGTECYMLPQIFVQSTKFFGLDEVKNQRRTSATTTIFGGNMKL